MGNTRITFWGDFRLERDDVSLSEELKEIIAGSACNALDFEAPVAGDAAAVEKSGPCISQGAFSIGWATRNGFNLFSLANNHIMDYGEAGLRSTIAALEGHHFVGAGLSAENAWRPCYMDLPDGKRLAVVAASHTEFGAMGIDNRAGYAALTDPMIEETIALAVKAADYTVVFAHAGVEYMDAPLPEWRNLYRHFINMGCCAVVAAHPHVPQGMEIWNGAPICYSLGNFCFDFNGGNTNPYRDRGLCCVLELHDGKASAEMQPIEFVRSERRIQLCKDETFISHVAEVSRLLGNENEYMAYVNTTVISLLPKYIDLFSRSGLVYSIFSKGWLKGFKDGLCGKRLLSKSHMLNNLQCESHRWAVSRALRAKYNLK